MTTIPVYFPEWTEHAACRGADPRIFFPTDEGLGNALDYCRRCAVQVDCLEEALTHQGGDFGVRGGTSERERRRILKRRRVEAEMEMYA